MSHEKFENNFFYLFIAKSILMETILEIDKLNIHHQTFKEIKI